jgi:hypothetical protein
VITLELLTPAALLKPINPPAVLAEDDHTSPVAKLLVTVEEAPVPVVAFCPIKPPT